MAALTAWTGAPPATGSTPATAAVDIVGEVGLVEDDDRLGARAPGQGQVALEPARVEVGVERGHDEQQVDVRGEDLLRRELGRPAPAG